MEHKSSLQDIIKQRVGILFVGRQAEIQYFRENLAYAPSDERKRIVLSVSGPGGIGKTALLRQFEREAMDADAITAFVSLDESRGVLAVMRAVVKELGEHGLAFESFQKFHRRFSELMQEVEADPASPKVFSYHLGRTLVRTDLIAGYLASPLPPDEGVENINGDRGRDLDWTTYVNSKLSNENEIQLLLDPIQVLTSYFIDDLQMAVDSRVIVFFFDTYEMHTRELDRWFLELLEGKYGDVPVSLQLVFSGRITLDKNLWAIFSPIIHYIELAPFTDEEARTFLAQRAITDQRAVDAMLQLSQNLPLILAISAQAWSNDPSMIGDPSEAVVDRFLKWISDPFKRRVVLQCSVARIVDRDIIEAILQQQAPDSIFRWLTNLSFVKKKRGHLGYHDVVRSQLIRRVRESNPEEWRTLHTRLYKYYQGLGKQLALGEKQKLKSKPWKDYALEALYHGLCRDPERNVSNASQGFLDALIAGDLAYAELWVGAIKEAGHDTDSKMVKRLAEAFSDLSKKHAPPPDLSIRVHVNVADRHFSISFVLDSPNASLGFHNHPTGTRTLLGSPREFQSRLIRKLEALIGGRDIDGRPVRKKSAKIASIGNMLFDELFSTEMKAAYRRWRKEAVSVQITSDEPWIPWELIKPYDDSNLDQIIDDDFLCMQFHLTRWLSGEQGAEGLIEISRLACIEASHVPGMAQLKYVKEEKKHILKLATAHHIEDISPIEATGDAVLDLLDNGDIDLLHFACHGNFDAEYPDDSVVILSDSYGLRAEDFHGRRQTMLSRDRPLIFLNACRAGQQGLSLTQLGGWAASLVGRCKCGAFIGPLWSVTDSLAYEFAKSFYSSLERGHTIGAATLEARRHTRTLAPDNPTWAAYSVYGHPNGHASWGGLP